MTDGVTVDLAELRGLAPRLTRLATRVAADPWQVGARSVDDRSWAAARAAADLVTTADAYAGRLAADLARLSTDVDAAAEQYVAADVRAAARLRCVR
jgi:hypothetical protein